MYTFIAQIDVSNQSFSTLSAELKNKGITVEKYFKSIGVVLLKSDHLIKEENHQCLSRLELLGGRIFRTNEEEQ